MRVRIRSPFAEQSTKLLLERDPPPLNDPCSREIENDGCGQGRGVVKMGKLSFELATGADFRFLTG